MVLLFFHIMCFFYSIWKLYLCHTLGKETSAFNKIDAMLLVLSSGPEALWMFANVKWATWNTFRYVLWQTNHHIWLNHHIWAKLVLPCWSVNEYIAAVEETQCSVFTHFSSMGESCIHWGTDYGHFCIIIYSRNINFCYKQSMPHSCTLQMRYTVIGSICRMQEGCLIFPISALWHFRTKARKARTPNYEYLLPCLFTKMRQSNECVMGTQ